MLRIDVNWLWVGRGVTERLHNQICGKAETGEIFQFIPGHWPRRVLAADRRHFRFAVTARSDSLDPQALPTIFCASVYPLSDCCPSTGERNTVEGPRPRCSRAF